VRQVAWLALVAAGLLLLATPGRRRWGVVGTVVAVVWAALHVLWCVKTIPWPSVSGASWLGYPVLSLAACTGLVAGTGLVAREVFPRARFAPALVALAAVLLPIVPRIAVFFHPDPWLAFFTATALWLVLRAARTGWSPWLGLASGLVMGLGALVRPSAALVIACLGLGALVVGRRRAVSFLVVGALGVLALAGPWWVAQTIRTGNPLQSNLNRPGYMLDHQPRSFYVSFPVRDLLLHPYRPRFENELLPRFHAELWADWGGNLFDRAAPTTVDRVTASSQSILGFGGDALVLGGFLALGIPALRRARHGALRPADSGLATATILFTIGWIAYVATLIRYPQAEGDPIKSNYVLFLAPACAIAAYAAARSLWRRGGLGRVLLCAWLALYLVSFGVMLAGAG
jgi:4-amino-4-deoxy-L-arabinose transferase-like glycosyltransferase